MKKPPTRPEYIILKHVAEAMSAADALCPVAQNKSMILTHLRRVLDLTRENL